MSFVCKFNDIEEETWLVDFSQSGHVITLKCADKKLPQDSSGFVLTREDHYDDWDYSDYNTVYRMMDSNHTLQLSNDGSVYVEPKIDVTVQAIWLDSNDAYGVRPDEVIVGFFNNGKKSFDDVLTKKNNYTIVHKDRIASRTFTIEAPDLRFYSKEVNGTTVTYSMEVPQPRQITAEDVNETIIEMFEGKPADHIINMYAAYCEQNLKNFYLDVPDDLKNAVEDVIHSDLFMINEDGTTSLIPINEPIEEE